MSKKLYIAYGSNLNLRQMAMRCPSSTLFGTGTLENYELQFKGSPHSAFATITPQNGKSIPVAVWELHPKDEKVLDIYEGYPNHYFKQNLPVTVNGHEISAMVYIMNPKMDFGIPTQRYYNTVYEGYQNCGMDVSVLNRAVDDSIEKFRVIEENRMSYSLYHDNQIDEYTDDFDEAQDYYEEEFGEDDLDDDESEGFNFGQMHL